MRLWIMLVLLIFCNSASFSQEQEPATEEWESALENAAQSVDAEIEDDSFLEQLSSFSRHPLNLNLATADELEELLILSDVQIQNLINYRRLLGNFVDIYELQAVPGWDIRTLHKLRPFVTVIDQLSLVRSVAKRWSAGEQNLVLRCGRTLEKALGYEPRDSSQNAYQGSPVKFLVRYKYNFKNLLQYSVTAEKDAGEPFFKGKQRKGFDFYSFHMFLRKLGIVKGLALGDFNINLGQGLIQWQSLAFTMSSSVLNVKRQSQVLKPYTGMSEFRFFRGIAVTLARKSWETSAYISSRKIDANLQATDSNATKRISSILVSGLHRTNNEMEKKNNSTEQSAGFTLKYVRPFWHISFNAVAFKFSSEIQKASSPYQLYAMRGSSFLNSGIDFSYTIKNMHLFGELAIDKSFNSALVSGVVVALDQKLDLVCLYRNISKAYVALKANAFTQAADPMNEKGFYVGISFRPSSYLNFDFYSDVFTHPWLKFQVDAPSRGKAFLFQLLYKPNKKMELIARLKTENKPANEVLTEQPLPIVIVVRKNNIRIQHNVNLNRELLLRTRWEVVEMKKEYSSKQQGVLAFSELILKPPQAAFSGNARIQFFDSDSFDSRLYAVESGLPNHFEVPVFYGNGFRYYLNGNFKWNSSNRLKRSKLKWIFSGGFSQSLYRQQSTIGTGLDKINSAHKTQFSLQLSTTKS